MTLGKIVNLSEFQFACLQKEMMILPSQGLFELLNVKYVAQSLFADFSSTLASAKG